MDVVRLYRALTLLIAALTVTVVSPSLAADVFPPGVDTDPRSSHFSVCYTGGCAVVAQLALTGRQRHEVAALFAPPSRGPVEERRRIARAVGLLERVTGARLGTDRDLGGTFAGLGRAGQLDCIDESVNTTTYLRLLAHMGFLRWHTVEDRVTRGFFLFGWPHTTAVIRDTTDNRRYAVDSWFEANGVPPHIVPLRRWRDGWRPPRDESTGTTVPPAPDGQ